MANHKSAKKRIKTNEKRRVRNRATISRLKTLVKRVEAAENKAEAEVFYKEAISYIDRVATHGKIHKNTAARKVSALTVYVNSFEEEVAAPAPAPKAAPAVKAEKTETAETAAPETK